MPTSSISIRFWGVRGSIACPGTSTARIGGHTPCVEIRCGGQVLIFDAGTGIRPLGNALMRETANELDIFLSHFHIDHVIGLPFFAPLFSKHHLVRVWAGNLLPAMGLEDAVRRLMSFPLFPIEIETFKAKVEFCDFRSGETLNPRIGLTLRTARLNHPGGATGYRLDYAGRSVAYLTDMDGGDGPLDRPCYRWRKARRLLSLMRLTRTTNWRHGSAGGIQAGSRAFVWRRRPV